ncbi:MAG: hemolysin family protein [Beijerinckiaceae bacterium]
MSSTDDKAEREKSASSAAAPAQDGWLSRLKGALGFKSTVSIRDDIEDALEMRGPAAEFTAQERIMLRNILSIRSVKVADVMIPRADIIAVSAEISLGDLLRVFRTQGHSRLPAYGETLDDPKGMVHIRDFLDFMSSKAETGLPRSRKRKDGANIDLGLVDLSVPLLSAKILRPVIYAPPSMPAMDLLVRMQATRTHMALVVDEYGGTDGLVSIEDLVEMIVGDIEDEHDDASRAMVEATAEAGRFMADAKATLDEVAKVVEVDLTEEAAAADVDTIGGLVVTLAQRVPARGELIKGPLGLEFEVLDADPRRIKRIMIHRRTGGMAQVSAPSERASVATIDPTVEDGLPVQAPKLP